MAAFCAAGQLDAVAELDRRMVRTGVRADSLRPAADEVAPVLALEPRSASRLVGLARRVDRLLPAAADALTEGRMDLSQLRLLAGLVREVPDPGVVAALEALAVQHAPRSTVGQLRHLLEAELLRLLPAWAAERARKGREERDVRLLPSPIPGCSRVVADLPLVDATAVWSAVNGIATAARSRGTAPDGEAEDRTLAQLRADGLVSVVTGLLSGAEPPAGDSGGVAGARAVHVPDRSRLAQLAEVQVVVAADALLGQSVLPGEVPGVGPVDVSEVRSLAADTRWRRLLADPVSGRLLDRGLTVYRPPAALRRHVVTRDGTCVAPTCTAPARTAQLDHTTSFGERGDDGSRGTTADTNLGPECERHHHAKTHLGWQLHQPEPGAFRWTSPTGLVHATAPAPLLPGWPVRRPEWGTAA